MNRFWDNLILPIIEKINAKYIVEIGSDNGINTRNILEYCKDNNAHMTAIDPVPKFDINEFKAKYGDKFEIYKELSLSRLPLLEDYDVILIDGDHNWYTVYNELKIIEIKFREKNFPLIFLHDVSWPYARRDLYYNPENIPETYRQPYKKLGIYLGQNDLKEKGGLNADLYNSIYANNPHNGVLTAIEEFIDESNLKFSFEVVEAFHGLGILYTETNKTEKIVKTSIENAVSDLLKIIEKKRLESAIYGLKLKSQNETLQENFKEIESKLEQTQNQLKTSEERIKEKEKENQTLKNQLKASGELIKQKNMLIHLIEKQKLTEREHLKKLNSNFDDLKSAFYEMNYFNNNYRSIKQRFVSKFPSLFIFLNRNNRSIKNALIHVKGYKSIKNNDLFDIGYYLKNNCDVRKSGVDPILHYIYHGSKEGRKPNPTFDGAYYLNSYRDVKNSNLNPLIHYSLYGLKEGRRTKENIITKNQKHLDDLKIKESQYPLTEYPLTEYPLTEYPLTEYPLTEYPLTEYPLTEYPLISIISSVYNKESSLYEYVDAWANQTYKGKIEVILVDDMSTDNSEKVIKCLQKIYKKQQNFKIKLIKNRQNLGNCVSRNKGILVSKGDILVIMDADCIVNKEFLNEHYKAHKNSYDICIGPMGVESKNRNIPLLHEELMKNKKVLETEMRLQYPEEKTAFMNCVTRNFSITKAFTKKINITLFDESFSYSKDSKSGFGWEDIEMGFKLYKNGAKIWFADNAISIHKTHTPEIPDYDKPQRSMKNFAKLIKKHPDILKIAPDWTLDTFNKISDWLKKYDYLDNPDEEYIKSLL